MPELIEEFFLSEAVRSENRGELQTTVGSDVFPKFGSDVNLSFEYGMTDKLQFSTELPYGIAATQQAMVPLSWSTVGVGTLYQFSRSSRTLAFSAGVEAELPVSSRGELEWEPELLAAKMFGPTQVHVSFIAGLSDDEREYAYNAATVTDLHSKWFPTLEFSGRNNKFGNQFYVTPGIYRHFAHRLEAGAAVATGSHFGVLFKLTWERGGDDDDDRD
jgi:hypothetical protein